MELYNLQDDIGESTDLATGEPTRFAEVRIILEAKYRELQRQNTSGKRKITPDGTG